MSRLSLFQFRRIECSISGAHDIGRRSEYKTWVCKDIIELIEPYLTEYYSSVTFSQLFHHSDSPLEHFYAVPIGSHLYTLRGCGSWLDRLSSTLSSVYSLAHGKFEWSARRYADLLTDLWPS